MRAALRRDPLQSGRRFILAGKYLDSGRDESRPYPDFAAFNIAPFR
jgi:hypothetical protein